jgi:hypothetical protein
MTRLPAPDDGPAGNRQPGSARTAGRPGEDSLEAQRARLAELWALILGRFRAYAHRGVTAAANGDGHEEGR